MWLTGCGAGTLAGPSATPGFKINGNVHGGPFPIQGATIRLMETQSNGVWNTATGSYKGQAKQLLSTTSNSLGYFTFPDTGWTCDAGQYAYIEVTGGHTTAQINNNVIQIGVIGACSTTLANQTEVDNVNVYISELSTVAAAYALGDFMYIGALGTQTDAQTVNISAPAANNSTTPGCTGSGNAGANALTCTHAGLGHAFDNAYNLVDSVTYGANQFPSGAARTSIPGNSQSLVPQALINTIGNIMQSCVDSGGGTVGSSYVPGSSTSSRCGDLFFWATPPNGTNPTNTLQVALNMARNPTTHVDELFKLQPRAVFFTPTMSSDTLSGNSSQLMAYTLSIFYTGTGLSGDAGMPYPVDVALDEFDNAYVAYSGGNTGLSYGAINGFSPNGNGLFAGGRSALINNPASLAVDSRSRLFLTNDTNLTTTGDLFYMSSADGSLVREINVPNGYAAGVAVDMANNVWVSRDASTGQSLYLFGATSYATQGFNTTPRMGAPIKRIYVDYNQNVLGLTSNTDTLGNANSTTKAQVMLFPFAGDGTGTVINKVSLSTTGGYAFAMSGGGTANPSNDTFYAPLSGQFNTETGFQTGTMTANGVGSYTGTSTTGATYTTPMGAAIDGAGNFFWPEFNTAGQVFWFKPTTPNGTSSTSVSTGTLISFFPCYPLNGQCYSNVSSYLRGMAVDSSGAIWYTADSTTGVVVQTFGMAAPSYPLLSYARGGVVIQ